MKIPAYVWGDLRPLWKVESPTGKAQFALPTMGAPAFWSSSTTVASNGDVKSRSILEEQVVGMVFVHMLSLTATGTSCRGRPGAPWSTFSGTNTNAFTCGFLAATTCLHAASLKVLVCSSRGLKQVGWIVASIARGGGGSRRSHPNPDVCLARASDPNNTKHEPNTPSSSALIILGYRDARLFSFPRPDMPIRKSGQKPSLKDKERLSKKPKLSHDAPKKVAAKQAKGSPAKAAPKPLKSSLKKPAATKPATLDSFPSMTVYH